jgi:hypothetical protein
MAVKKKAVRKTHSGGDAKSPKVIHHYRRNGPLGSAIAFVLWVTGVLVALAVGFGMISETLSIPWLSSIITVSAGWVVVVLTLVGTLFKIIESLS